MAGLHVMTTRARAWWMSQSGRTLWGCWVWLGRLGGGNTGQSPLSTTWKSPVAKVTTPFTLDDLNDPDLLLWLGRLPRRKKPEVIRKALRAPIRSSGSDGGWTRT